MGLRIVPHLLVSSVMARSPVLTMGSLSQATLVRSHGARRAASPDGGHAVMPVGDHLFEVRDISPAPSPPERAARITCSLGLPDGSGYVRLASAGPIIQPHFDYRYLQIVTAGGGRETGCALRDGCWNCRVKGVQGLFGADASVTPRTPRSDGAHATVIMIGERAVEWIAGN